MHILARLGVPYRLVGYSDWNGFTLYGEIATEAVAWAAHEALARLQAGQSALAVHPRCGTNIVGLVLAAGGMAALVGSLPASSRIKQVARILFAALPAVMLSRPLGYAMQQHITTSGDLRGARIRRIQRDLWGGVVRHRVLVAHEPRGNER